MPRLPRCFLALAAVFLMLAVDAAAQRLETGFEREVNRFRWTSTALYGIETSDWRFQLRNKFLSDAFILFGDQLRFRDEDRLSVEVERKLATRHVAGVHTRTAWYGLSQTFTQEVYGTYRLTSSGRDFLESYLGVAWDRRPRAGTGAALQRPDVGPVVGFGGEIAPRSAAGYTIRLAGDGSWQRITPRRAGTLHLQGEADRQFGSARLTSGIRLSSHRRDTYRAVSFLNRDAAMEAIEATTSDTLEFNLLFETPVFRGISLMSQTDIRANNRFIRTHNAPEAALFFETNFNRRAIDTELGLVYTSLGADVRLAVEAGAVTERRNLANSESLPRSEATQKNNLLRQADYEEGVFGVRGRFRLTIVPRVTMTATASSRIVRHDTPDVNPDDRDEIYHNGEIGMQLRLSRYVQSDVRVFGSWYHAVYLKAERSADNSVQRSLRLRPTIRWRPSERTDLRFVTEVRATYTVDDFVLPGRRSSDQSARELRFETDIERRLGSDVVLRATGSHSDLRLGRLLWTEFAEIPVDTLRTYSMWVRLQTGTRLLADVGWRLFVRTDFDRVLSVRYPLQDADGNDLFDDQGHVRTTTISRPGRRWIEQQGPTAGLVWTVGASRLRLDAWANMQRIRRRLYGTLPDNAADSIRAAARTGTRKLIPTVALTVSWVL